MDAQHMDADYVDAHYVDADDADADDADADEARSIGRHRHRRRGSRKPWLATGAVAASVAAILIAVGAFGANRGVPDAAPSHTTRPSIVDTAPILLPPSSVPDASPSPTPTQTTTPTTTPTPGVTTSTTTQAPANSTPPPTTNPPSPTPSPTPTGPTLIAVPPHQMVITGAPGRCVDVNGNVWANGTTVQSWGCNPSGAQKFSFNANGTLSGGTGSGFCLAPAGAGAGSPMQVRTCGGANQTWQFRSDKSLFNVGSGLCLNDPGYPATNRQLTMAACTGAGSQQWTYS